MEDNRVDQGGTTNSNNSSVHDDKTDDECSSEDYSSSSTDNQFDSTVDRGNWINFVPRQRSYFPAAGASCTMSSDLR